LLRSDALLVLLQAKKNDEWLARTTAFHEQGFPKQHSNASDTTTMDEARATYIMSMIVSASLLMRTDMNESKLALDCAHRELLQRPFEDLPFDWILYFIRSHDAGLSKEILEETRQYRNACTKSTNPELSKNLVAAQFQLARCLWRSDQKEKARTEFAKAASLLREDLESPAPVTLGGQFAEVYISWLAAANVLENYPDLKPLLKRIRQSSPVEGLTD
jgi:hypothetical protein